MINIDGTADIIDIYCGRKLVLEMYVRKEAMCSVLESVSKNMKKWRRR